MAARLIAEVQQPWQQRYVAGFVAGLARQIHDPALWAGALAATDSAEGLARLATMLTLRLSAVPKPFAAI